jgi:hypothetical protein
MKKIGLLEFVIGRILRTGKLGGWEDKKVRKEKKQPPNLLSSSPFVRVFIGAPPGIHVKRFLCFSP